MAEFSIANSSLGGNLLSLLMADDIEPGSEPSYQLCKTLFLWHPLGLKMAETPVQLVQSQQRIIAVPAGPEKRLLEAFNNEWRAFGADEYIFNLERLARVYGVASIGVLTEGVDPSEPLDMFTLHEQNLAVNVYDPLNTAGSLVLNQNPNSMSFQKPQQITISGDQFHRSRSIVRFNEKPIYLGYTTSAFGYVGRSVYQRALFPLKSFIQSMITDDMVTLKAGLIIAKMKAAGSIIDNLMQSFSGQKRQLLKEGRTSNVLSIDTEESVETLNMNNIQNAMEPSRKNILENIAAAADMPSIILNNETFAEGFGEGTEDAKAVAAYIERMRLSMQPLYDYFDNIIQHRAWNPDFYKSIQADYPDEWGKVPYQRAITEWKNSFTAIWPNLLTEPDSEKVKVDETRLRAVISMIQVLAPMLDPENLATLVEWGADNFNDLNMLFKSPLILDYESIVEHLAKLQEKVNQQDDQAAEEVTGAETGIMPMTKVAKAKPIHLRADAAKILKDLVTDAA